MSEKIDKLVAEILDVQIDEQITYEGKRKFSYLVMDGVESLLGKFVRAFDLNPRRTDAGDHRYFVRKESGKNSGYKAKNEHVQCCLIDSTTGLVVVKFEFDIDNRKLYAFKFKDFTVSDIGNLHLKDADGVVVETFVLASVRAGILNLPIQLD